MITLSWGAVHSEPSTFSAGPSLRPDGSECHQHHDLMVTLGGESWLRFVVGEDRDKTN